MRFLRKSFTGLFLMAATLALILFAVNMVSGALSARGDGDDRRGGGRERVFVVNVLPFQPGTETPVLTVFGEVQSLAVLDMRAAVGGDVVELHPAFSNGGQVNAGDLVVRIDPSNAQSALALAQADMTDAQADLRDAQAALILAQDELDAAREQADLRDKAARRQRDLLARGVGTAANSENAELAASTARQSVLSRRQALQNATARITTAQSRVARIEISLSEAQRNLADTKIFAPFAGVLSDVSLVLGTTVTPGERLGQLIDPAKLEVAFRVSTNQHARLVDEAGRLRPAPVDVVLSVLGADITIPGKLSREAPVVGEGSTGRLLFATLDDPSSVRPGDFVTVQIKETPLQRVARLPASAVSSASRVLVVGDEDRLREADVRLVRRQGNEVLVRSRDLVGQSIVSERSPLLGAGIKVRPLVPGDADKAPEAPKTVKLDDAERAKMIAFVEANTRMPKAVKDRMLQQLQKPEIPLEMATRLRGRIGG